MTSRTSAEGSPHAGTALKVAWFCSLFFLAFALGGSLAHVYEMPHKLALSGEDYLTVQQIYRGWAMLGVAVFGALGSTLTLMVMLRRLQQSCTLVGIALLSILGTQAIFWTFTFPANQATNNWTVLPDNWLTLRDRWEWSHAAGAALNIIAFAALVLSLLVRIPRASISPAIHR